MHRVLGHRSPVLVEQRALRRRHARAVLEVLDAEGHARQRTRVVAPSNGVVDLLCRSARQISVEMHEGVEARVAGGDGVEALVEHLGRLELSPPDSLGNVHDRAHRRSH